MGSETSTGRKRHGDCISKEEYIKCYSFEDNNTPEDNTEGKPNKKLIEKAFEIALDTRKFEIDLYWKRTAYFVLFIGAIFVGYYNQMVSLIITISWFLTFIKEALIFNEKDKQTIKDCCIIDNILIFLEDNILWRTIIEVLIIILLSCVVIFRCKGFAAKKLDKEDSINYFWNYSSELQLRNNKKGISKESTTKRKEKIK